MPGAHIEEDDIKASSAPLSPHDNGIKGHSHDQNISLAASNGVHQDIGNGVKQEDEPQENATDKPVTPAAISSKKRKLDEFDGRSRSASRAASPPWKSFGADGPTQFTEGGKRRSGRVNLIPLEHQAPSDKRTTRKAFESAGSKRLKLEDTLKSVKSKPEVSASSPKPGALRKPATKRPQDVTHEKDASQPTRISSRRRSSPKRFDDDTIEPPRQRDNSSPIKKRMGRPKKRENTPPSPNLHRVKRESLSDATKEIHAPQTSPRLRLKLPRQPHYPRHPDTIPKPSKFESLIEVLEAYDVKERESGQGDKDDGDVLDSRAAASKVTKSIEEIAEAEARSRLRILDAAKPGGPLSDERCSLFFPDQQQHPPNQYSHRDHLWAHGAYFRHLLDRESVRHRELAKRTAQACLAKWKERQPQTEEDREKEENEWYRLTYKQTVKDMARKWELVAAEIERQRLQQWIEEEELTRDRKMQRMLEDTTAMLEKRRVGFEDDEIDSEILDDSSEATDEDGSGQNDEEEDDDIMSSSESDNSEDGGSSDADADENLSPEALRRKYENLPELQIEQDSDSVGSDTDDMDLDTADNTAAATPDVADMSHVQLEEVDDALLDDEDDESTDMSDDMSSSEDDNDDGERVEDEESEEEDAGLFGFFGGRERKRIQELQVEEPDSVGEQETPGSQDPADKGPSETVPSQDDGEAQLDMHSAPQQLETSLAGDHSSQPTPMDSSTTALTEAESATTIDSEETTKGMLTAEETQTTRSITTKVPSLLRGTLREYQHFGLDWLAKLYANQTNGILADEMGLGKTIQTIALLAHLAEEHEVWGPHLIVVPTSVILNWEMEFKKFLPGFRVLSYYGTQEERQQKRKGWSNPDNYNVVITSYQLILKDLSSIRVPEWHYMILDEAHNIKNFQSQRYQAMIRLKTHARLLLTGTPLQNSIQELWSLLTFLTAGQDGQGMGDLDEFTQWFKRPVDEIFVDGKNKLGVEAQEIVNKLHHSLRPYILRRMKAQVERQLPGKYEHTIFCRLSKRQRQLYDAFLSRADVKEKLSSGNPISVSQALMALRKVCNHPDLFEERPIVTSFTFRKPYSRMPRSVVADYEIKDLIVRRQLLQEDTDQDFDSFITRNFDLHRRERYSKYHAGRGKRLLSSQNMRNWWYHFNSMKPATTSLAGTHLSKTFEAVKSRLLNDKTDRLEKYMKVTEQRAEWSPMYGCDLVAKCTIRTSDRLPLVVQQPRVRLLGPAITFDEMDVLPNMVQTSEQRSAELNTVIQKFSFVTPNAIAHDVLSYAMPSKVRASLQALGQSKPDPFHESRVRLSIAFPDKRLLQFDCGKLQRLAILLRELTSRGSRALIFTQMTSVLDILERFLNIHGYKYMRLDGSTRIEQRQDMMERFNRDTRVDVFILSSRSGGVGMNLTGADSVIFYDLDWNPQMDKQCQDRAHRIGQTRDVHIYKMVSEHTIEVNILRKSNQKRMLDEVVIQEGEFTTDFFTRDDDEDDDDDKKRQETEGAAATVTDEAGLAVDRVLGLETVGKVLEKAEEGVDVEAARAMRKEQAVDERDWEFDARKMGESGAATPKVEDADEDEDEDGQDKPHVDEYMLRFVRRALEGVPFVPPVDKKKGRLDKNGRDRSHRPKKM